MDMGEVKTRNLYVGVGYSKDRQAERIRAYEEALQSMALAKEKYENVKMEATVKAFVEGSKSQVDIKKYMNEEALESANRERETKRRMKNENEQRICIAAIGMAVVSVVLAALFVCTRG